MRRAADAAVYTAARNSDINCSSLSPLFLSTNLVGWLYYNSVFFICQYFFWLFQAFFERFNYRMTEVEYASVLKAGFRPCRIRNLANKSVFAAGFALPEQKSAQTKPIFTRQQKFLISYLFFEMQTCLRKSKRPERKVPKRDTDEQHGFGSVCLCKQADVRIKAFRHTAQNCKKKRPA